MRVIAITSTYPASALQEADAIIQKLAQIQVSVKKDGRPLEVNIVEL
jgi:hypothetical protein